MRLSKEVEAALKNIHPVHRDILRAALEAAPDPEEVALLRAVAEADRTLRDTILTWLDNRERANMGRLTTAIMDAAEASNVLTAWQEANK